MNSIISISFKQEIDVALAGGAGMGNEMTLIEERTARLEAENAEIRKHFATKADVERGLRLQTVAILGVTILLHSVTIGAIFAAAALF